MGEPPASNKSPPKPPPPPPAPAPAPAPTPAAEPVSGNKPLTMRGRKRHKCMVCGNIARSRCPFFSCKGCCVKAANACHIHVLKPSPTGESVQGSAATVPIQGPTTTSTIVRHPYDSLRLRTLRPSGLITKKDAGIINSWRFRKVRTYIEGLNAYEEEVFDRYMQNNLMLEELFNASCPDSLNGQGPLLMPGCSAYETSDGGIDMATVSAIFRARQRISLKKREAHKQRLKRAVDRSLQKLLYKGEETDDFTENEEMYVSGFAARRELKRMKVQSTEGKDRLRRMEIFSALIEKLKVVDNQEDIDGCLKTYSENFVHHKTLASVQLEGALQTAALKASGAEALGARENSSALDVTFNGSFKSRLDTYGVMKEMWEVDSATPSFDGSLSSVETL